MKPYIFIIAVVFYISTSTISRANEDVPPSQEKYGQSSKENTAEDVLLRNQKILGAKNDFSFELDFNYSRNEKNLIRSFSNGNGTTLYLTNLTYSALNNNISLNYNVTNNIQMYANTSYLYEQQTEKFGNTIINEQSHDREESVTIGGRTSLRNEDIEGPQLVSDFAIIVPTNVDKSPYGLNISISSIKNYDPVVLFSSLSALYYQNKEIRGDDYIAKPNTTLSSTIGYSFSMNNKLALTTSISAEFTSATTYKNNTTPSQQYFFMSFGLNTLMHTGLYMEPKISFKLNGTDSHMLFNVSVIFSH